MEQSSQSSQTTTQEFMRHFLPEEAGSVEALRQAVTAAENRLEQIQKLIQGDIQHAKQEYLESGDQEAYDELCDKEQQLYQEVHRIIDFIQDCDNQADRFPELAKK